MRPTLLIPIAVLAFAAACSDTATSPTSVGGPQFLTTGTFGNVTQVNAAGTPGGGHLQSGSPIQCFVDASLNITCSSNGTYTINGVGHTNATATISAQYSATVDCTNNGGKLVPVKSTPQTSPATSGPIASDRNGGLTVAPISSTAPTTQQFLDAATCPNGNWTKSLEPGTPTLTSFTYTLVFAGFTTPSVSITASD
jgi:hypothetical protein